VWLAALTTTPIANAKPNPYLTPPTHHRKTSLITLSNYDVFQKTAFLNTPGVCVACLISGKPIPVGCGWRPLPPLPSPLQITNSNKPPPTHHYKTLLLTLPNHDVFQKTAFLKTPGGLCCVVDLGDILFP